MKILSLPPDSLVLESYTGSITVRSRIIYWMVTGFILLIIALLPLIRTDISVSAPGFFQSDIEKQKIIIPYSGRIIAANVRNGSRVEKGDTLFIIDSESFRVRRDALEIQIKENDQAINDLELLCSADPTGNIENEEEVFTGRYRAELSALRKAIDIQEEAVARITSEYHRARVLYESEIIPPSEFENKESEFRTGQESLRQIVLDYLNRWESDLLQRRLNGSSLKGELSRYNEEIANRVILAPVSGEVIQSNDIQKGMIVGMNQEVAEISPDGQLVALCLVSPSDIGLINDSLKVKIQVDALNYTEWGLLDARISEIPEDMVIENASLAYFRVRCIPEKTYLTLKNGARADLKKGMSFNARIIITQRTLFNLLFDKLDKWLNPSLNK